MAGCAPARAGAAAQLTAPDAQPAPAGAPLDLSIVVPVYNEEENLPLLWPEIRGVLAPTGLRYEVIFVDDGSRDRSAEIVREFRAHDRRVRLVRLTTNAGETAATDAGLKVVRGRHVVVMDADLQNDPHDIPAMLKQLDQWDAVTGWRVNRAAGDSWVRRLSSRIANRVRNRLSEETIQDSGCTFRAFRRECLRDLVLYKGFHRFIPTLLKMRGFRVLEVPVNHRPRRFGRSKYGIGNRAVRAFVDLLVVRWIKDRVLRYEIVEDLGGDAGGVR
jgi:dolichol-phosphate mannosyltransferase